MSDEVDLNTLKIEYDDIKANAKVFLNKLRNLLIELLSRESIVANIVESRVKEWKSILRNINEKGLVVDKIINIADLIGIRFIFLFKSDIKKAGKIIEDNLFLIDKKIMAERLEINQFGYQSDHYEVKLTEDRLRLDDWIDFRKFQAEIQVSTLAQHIWTAVSSKYDYHSERDTPEEIKRSVALLSAELEIVDREIKRIDDEREMYREQSKKDLAEDLVKIFEMNLNVDILDLILIIKLPSENRVEDEPFSDLLKDLETVGIITGNDLVDLIDKHEAEAIKRDSEIADYFKLKYQGKAHPFNEELKYYYSSDPERIKKGVFFSFAGLVKEMLDLEFGEDWREEEAIKT
jgi:ppGpp synthetase/RelA/SpoT-type nucleotidyltranferase